MRHKEKPMPIFPFTSLSTLFAVLIYFVLSVNVARARKTYGIVAPAVTGHLEFEKRYRVQMNTVEQFIVFLPILWLSAVWVGDGFAASMGLIWSLGRILYARGYYAAAEKRGPGFGLCALATIGMLLVTLFEVIKSIV
jgi:glutathione S-transferase